ncbi:MAG: hypothetical protein FWH49_03735 [Clostridiales bacterium]|nr:hypothetical protein [Clostridiales bacterium]
MRLTDLLEQWSSRDAPGAADKIMDRENGCIAAAVLILLNGRSVKSEDPETVLISPGDSIKIMPILLGG